MSGRLLRFAALDVVGQRAANLCHQPASSVREPLPPFRTAGITYRPLLIDSSAARTDGVGLLKATA